MLTALDHSNLLSLANRKDTAVELANKQQIDYWSGMEQRGYARISKTARSGFEIVQGNFVSITEAGRLALSMKKEAECQI